jgi:amidase
MRAASPHFTAVQYLQPIFAKYIGFSVEVEAGGAPSSPRMENAEYLMASGISGSIDDAFRGATTNLVQWLEKMYGLNPAEASSVLGTSIVYDIAEVVDPQPHVVAKVPKSLLQGSRRRRYDDKSVSGD